MPIDSIEPYSVKPWQVKTSPDLINQATKKIMIIPMPLRLVQIIFHYIWQAMTASGHILYKTATLFARTVLKPFAHYIGKIISTSVHAIAFGAYSFVHHVLIPSLKLMLKFLEIAYRLALWFVEKKLTPFVDIISRIGSRVLYLIFAKGLVWLYDTILLPIGNAIALKARVLGKIIARIFRNIKSKVLDFI